MPSLRKLLLKVNPIDAAYELLEALVAELEAQHPPQVDARIAELNANRDIWKRHCQNAERSLSQAKAEIESLEKNCDYLRQQMTQARDTRAELCRQLTEAKAETGELRTLWLSERNHSGKLHEERNNLQRRLAQLTASVNADAEIGRLVRGMADGTRLTRFFTGYAIEAQGRDSVWHDAIGIGPRGIGARYDDPAEALRVIQEVGDGEE